MSGTKAVRELLTAELRQIDKRRQSILDALAELDAACDHAHTTIEPWGQTNSLGYNGAMRCDECGEITSWSRSEQVTA